MENAAIILAAGRGNRLRPLTEKIPKCMVTSPDGVPLLHRAARKLQEAGVAHLIVGVGFQKDSVTLPPLEGMTVHRVENCEWEKTNNIYTLNLCFDYAKNKHLEFDALLLIEGDVYLGDKIIQRLLMEAESGAAVLPASYTKRGSCVSVDDQGYVRILRDNRDWNDPSIFKLANLYKLTRSDFFELGRQLPRRNKSQYYETIMGELVGRVRLKAIIDGECREIDNAYDRFCLADSLNLDYETIRSNWGGLWRRSVQDHFFISNPFYPTPFIRDRLKYSFDALIDNYPSGRTRLNAMLKAFCSVDTEFPLFALNGASEGIRTLENYFREKKAKFCLRFSPTFGEYLRFDLVDDPEQGQGVIIVSPNNPTAERVEMGELIQLLDKYEYVLLDLSLSTDKDRPYLELILKHPNLIVVKSLSKLFGIPGIRLGYVAVDARVFKDFEATLPIWNVNSIAEGFLELHLDSLSDYEHAIEQWQNESLRLQDELEGMFSPDDLAATTGFIAVTTDLDLVRPLYRDYGIFVADTTSKYAEERFHMRIGVKNREQNDYLKYALRSSMRKNSDR
ncbi:MAG TPA: aminotransferase class I/II-fold pyridoxal phosphate-dependent enzyme [Candidatus Acidoferrales bacterium]|nr:aminotransferase class I/II-fold pyridoxal phosphate-dependent enzyme [Candidatus Acidoferrales bacterium]